MQGPGLRISGPPGSAAAAPPAPCRSAHRRIAGSGSTPVTRLVGTLGGLGAELASIRDALGNGHASHIAAQLAPELRALRDTVAAAALRATADSAAKDPEDWLVPRLDALTRWPGYLRSGTA